MSYRDWIKRRWMKWLEKNCHSIQSIAKLSTWDFVVRDFPPYADAESLLREASAPVACYQDSSDVQKVNNPKVAIIVLNWNGLDDTVECIESLKKLAYADCRVVVVDNGSAGNDVSMLRERFGNYLHLIENNVNCGFAEGNNIGIRYALTSFNPDYILLLNNDTVVDTEMLTELVKAAESDTNIGMVGPKICSYSTSDRAMPTGRTISGPTTEPSIDEINKVRFTEMIEVNLIFGCALLIKPRVIDKIGLLYPGYFAYYEDAEYCIRCRKAGFKLVQVPTAVIWHKGKGTSGKVTGLTHYYMTRNQFLFVARNCSKRRVLCFLLLFLFWSAPLTVAGFVLRNDQKGLKIFCKGAFDGIKFILPKQHRQ